MFYFYIVAAIGLIPVLNNFFPLLRESYSWWLVPVLALANFLIFIILHFGFLALYIQCLSIKKEPKGSRFLRKYVEVSVKLFYKFALVHLHSSGLEKVPDEGRVLIVCNHRSEVDPAIILSELADLEVAFVAKKEVYKKLPFVAKALHKMNGLPIDRENNREAAKTIINAVKIIKDDKASIGIYPEGYTNRTEDDLLPLRSGCFKIAERAQVPIVVCTVYNSVAIFKNMFRRRSDVYFDVAEVIPAQQVKEMHTDAISERVAEIMKKSIEERRNSINSGKKK